MEKNHLKETNCACEINTPGNIDHRSMDIATEYEAEFADEAFFQDDLYLWNLLLLIDMKKD